MGDGTPESDNVDAFLIVGWRCGANSSSNETDTWARNRTAPAHRYRSAQIVQIHSRPASPHRIGAVKPGAGASSPGELRGRTGRRSLNIFTLLNTPARRICR